MADDDAVAPVEPGNPTPEQKTPDQIDAVDTNAPDDAPKSETILEAAPDGKTPVAADWRDDWREELAGGDKKELKRLQRYKSMKDFHQASRASAQKLSEGPGKIGLASDASDEEVAAYRKDNGIPEKPDGYLENLPNGLVIGEDDKPLVNSFLERAHGKNADPVVVADTLDWYYDQQEEQVAEQSQSDKAYRAEGVEELRGEWGAEYKGNLNSALSFLDMAPQGDGDVSFKDNLLGARMADGTLLGDNPGALRWLAKLADDANPAGFVSPGAGMSQIDSVNDEIASIEKTMRTDRNAYDKDPKMQDRYLKLLGAQEKLSAA